MFRLPGREIRSDFGLGLRRQLGFTKEELEELIREADVKGATVCRAPVFRLVGMSVKIQGLDT